MNNDSGDQPVDTGEQREIEAAFVESWGRIEQFYMWHFYMNAKELRIPFEIDLSEVKWWQNLESVKSGHAWLKPIMGLIAEMRQRGYDHQFRAGQALYTLVLSRSRIWGMRREQHYVAVDIRHEHGMRISYWDGDDSGTAPSFEQEQIALTPELEQLLARLLEQPID